jgi:hypothetical protein
MGYKSRQKLARRIQEGKVSMRPEEPAWTSLERAFVNGQHTVFHGNHHYKVYKNSRYTVLYRMARETDASLPDLVHLSIKRNDQKPIWNWRDFQKIKNELVGEECEGIMLFPAESRLVDTSSQYHLYVCKDPQSRFPVGYRERLVCEGNYMGSIQEPFEPHVRPADLVPPEVMQQRLVEYHDEHKPDL